MKKLWADIKHFLAVLTACVITAAFIWVDPKTHALLDDGFNVLRNGLIYIGSFYGAAIAIGIVLRARNWKRYSKHGVSGKVITPSKRATSGMPPGEVPIPALVWREHPLSLYFWAQKRKYSPLDRIAIGATLDLVFGVMIALGGKWLLATVLLTLAWIGTELWTWRHRLWLVTNVNVRRSTGIYGAEHVHEEIAKFQDGSDRVRGIAQLAYDLGITARRVGSLTFKNAAEDSSKITWVPDVYGAAVGISGLKTSDTSDGLSSSKSR